MKLRTARAGDKPNENVVKCRICKSNGFPHEAIDFRKVNSGRIKNDGSYEFERYEVLDYFNGNPHIHRRSGAAAGVESSN